MDETHVAKRQQLVSVNDESDSASSDEETTVTSSLPTQTVQDLYLETVDRSRLDFDFEPNCSISLSNVNVYACLVCGKYLQGRGRSSYAFAHSINDNHHIFINLSTLKIYVLPENYEVAGDSSLDDIKYLVSPTYDIDMVRDLHKSKLLLHDLNGNDYRPGFIGINNSNNKNDYANVVIQLLSHVDQLRDSMLLLDANGKDQLINDFSLTIRKLWSSRLFKSHISPHALLQLIFKNSNKKFSIDTKSDPKEFVIWLLNNLALSLPPERKKTIINKTFQGKLELPTGKLTRFWILSLDLPHSSLFKDGASAEAVAEVSLSTLLSSKYSGKIVSLPQTLILHFNRFLNGSGMTSISGSTRNSTIVNFPLEIDMAPYMKDSKGPVKYRLVSNIIHELVPLTSLENNDTDTTNWKIRVLDKVRGDWLTIQDLKVEPEVKVLQYVDETYIQFWERI